MKNRIKYLLFILLWTLLNSCKNKHDNNILYNKFEKIKIQYFYFSSLDETKLNYNGILSYSTDSVMKYNLVVNDSALFYNYGNEHGYLNLVTGFIDKNNEIDEFGLPSGNIAADLFPDFINNPKYLLQLQENKSYSNSSIKNIGTISLIEINTKPQPTNTNELVNLDSSKDYICFNNNNEILFEFSVANFSMGELSFTQKELKKYSYSENEISDLNEFTKKINSTSTNDEYLNDNYKDTITYMPDFTFYDLENHFYSSKNIKEKIVFVEFWYISCAPCLKNMKLLNDIYMKNKEKDIKFLILNDADLNEEKIMRIKEKYNLKYSLFYKGADVSKKLKIQIHPYSLIYDNKTRKILHKEIGSNSRYKENINLKLDSIIN